MYHTCGFARVTYTCDVSVSAVARADVFDTAVIYICVALKSIGCNAYIHKKQRTHTPMFLPTCAKEY